MVGIHMEDSEMCGMSYLINGATKHWYVVSPMDAEKFERNFAVMDKHANKFSEEELTLKGREQLSCKLYLMDPADVKV